MKGAWPRVLLLAVALGCATTAARAPAPTPAPRLAVPIVRQSTVYTCGAAALMAVLYYWQVYDGREDELAARLRSTPEEGTHPAAIIEIARAYGLAAEAREGVTVADLRAGLARGDTVIIDLQAWHGDREPGFAWRDAWEDGHYVVLVAMDERHATVMDPVIASGYVYLPLAELADRWHDYENEGPARTRRDYHHLALFIRGTRPMAAFPGPPVRME